MRRGLLVPDRPRRLRRPLYGADAAGRTQGPRPRAAQRAAERTFGWTADEVVGRELAELIVPRALRARHREGLARYLAGGAPVVLDQRVEIIALRRDGSEFPCELTITRIAQPGDPLFVGYVRDITERHDAEAELRASRARIVTAADDARRRLERDLHDGAQQHLVGLALTLRLARRRVHNDAGFAAELLDEAIEDLATATGELRELARGLHPAVLTEGGLEPALVSVAKRATVPVSIEHAPEERLPPTVEITAYFVVAEALTNVARYAEASRAFVSVRRAGAVLVVEVRDDGRGGARMDGGSGLRGLLDRQRGPLERLTEREGEVLQMMAEGKTNRAISQQLYMSERAVERHVTAIFIKLDLPVTDQDHRRVLAVLAYLRG